MKKELLAPAGDMESLYAAIHGGCDAVYASLKDFGARKYAKNFSREELSEAVKICHLYNVKIYITLNTLVKDNEVDNFLDTVDYLYNINVDAVLVQDFGMLMLIREMYPDLEVHASTQFNNSSVDTVKLLESLGVKRVVLSRELSIDEIDSIDTTMEKEVFIHGALCISYSGNCLLSSMIGNRSGNRGECAGSCRLPYKLYLDNKLINDGYLLSTKELNTMPNFDRLLNSSIKSYKIEGRMKSPEYVYFITKLYRNLIDGKKNNIEDINTLKILFNRGFTTGNLFNDYIMNTKSPNHLGLEIGEVIDIDNEFIKIKLNRRLYQEDGIRFSKSGIGMIVNYLYDKNKKLTNSVDDICYVKNSINLKNKDKVSLTSSKVLKKELLNYEKKRIGIDVSVIAKKNKPLTVMVNDLVIEKDIVEEAKNMPITKENIIKQLSRLNDSVYTINSLKIDMDSDIFIPVSKLNEIRRKMVEKLNSSRLEFKRLGKKDVSFSILSTDTHKYNSIIIDNDEELSKCNNYDRYYTSNKDLFNRYKDKLNIYYIEERNRFNNVNSSNTLVREYSFPNNSISDYTFNVTNIYSVYYLLKLGYSCVTLSVELDSIETNFLISNFKNKFKFEPSVEVVVKDRYEVMFIKGNVLNIKENIYYDLIDLRKRDFKAYYDGVNTHIFNYEVVTKNNVVSCSKRYNYKYLK